MVALYRIRRLNVDDAERYERFTFQHLRERFRRLDRETSWYSIGAEYESQPAALVLAEIHQEIHAAEILSLFVDKNFRKKGIASRMMSELQRGLLEQGITYVKASFYSGKSSTETIERFFQSGGWTTPVTEAYVFKADMRIQEARWLDVFQYPETLKSFVWTELKEEERVRLQDADLYAYPDYLSPFKNEKQLEKTVTLGLRNESGVIGWNLVHRIAADTFMYSGIYIVPAYQHMGYAMSLMAESIKIQLRRQIPYAMFAIRKNNAPMLKMGKRWLQPYLCQTSEMRTVYKALK